MGKDDIIQIRIGNYSVGIVGLREAVEEMADEFAHRTHEEIGEAIVERLRKRNYIPDRAKETYKKAFVREFKKFQGQEVAEDRAEGLEIKVLGPGCAQCNSMEQELLAAMSETGIAADLEHVRDVKEIGKYGVMGTPALIINGKVKSVGKVPPRAKLKEWPKEAVKDGAVE